jgi:4'-phosphopantetheinyl transferase
MITRVWLYLATADDVRGSALTRYYEGLLSAEERAQGQSCLTDRLREQYLLGRALARRALSRHSSIPPAAWQFTTNPFGRPMISGPAGAPRLNFNLTHADGLVACVVSAQGEVGVDTEVIDRTTGTTLIAEQYFCPLETADLKSLSGPLQRDRFFQYWTLKEAFVKARGLGLSMPLNGFSFDLRDGQPIRVHFEPPAEEEASAWHFFQLRPTGRHVVAVACRACSPPELIVQQQGRGQQ